MTEGKKPTIELSVVGLEKKFSSDLFKKTTHSLKGVNLEFPKNKCTGLIGHNGAGKTTTIRIILGLLHQNSGQVLFRGQPIKNEDRRLIGYMPEANHLPKNLTCYEVLKYHLKLYGQSADSSKISQTLEQVGLANSKGKITRELSKGMARRLAWAQATIHQPELIILDEPFSGMDPLGRLQMKEWLGHHRNSDTTLILCTHEVDSMYETCDFIHVLKKGKLAFSTLHSVDGAPKLADIGPKFLVRCQTELANRLSSESPEPRLKNDQDGSSNLLFQDKADADTWIGKIITAGGVIDHFGITAPTSNPKFLDLFDGGGSQP